MKADNTQPAPTERQRKGKTSRNEKMLIQKILKELNQ